MDSTPLVVAIGDGQRRQFGRDSLKTDNAGILLGDILGDRNVVSKRRHADLNLLPLVLDTETHTGKYAVG